MVFRTPRRLPGGRKAIVFAVLVHALLIGILVVGVRWQSKPQVPARPIQAQAVNDAETQREIERRKRAERERSEQEAKKQREQQERERKAAEERQRAEQAKLAEQKRKDEAKRQAVDAEKKRKEQERQAEAKRQEQQRQAEAKRKEQERQAEVKRKKEAEERRQAAEQSLKEQLVSEERERKAAQARAEQAARAQSELARYEGLIRQKVERNWVRPAGWSKGLECVVRVRLAPTGEVIQATVIRPSGSPPFDRSVENAVYKASPLPLPEDKGLFDHFRELELRFRPEGLT